MSAEEIVVKALAPLVKNPVYVDVADQGVLPPWIVYQVVGGEIAVDLSGTPFNTCCTRLQVAVWHDVARSRSALMRRVLSALIAPEVGAIPIGAPTNVFDHDARLYGSRIDVNVWSEF